MKKLVMLLALLAVGGDGGERAAPTQGKCGDRNCSSSACTGVKKDCGEPGAGSCPQGNCISKAPTCCCAKALLAGAPGQGAKGRVGALGARAGAIDS